jgi:hypothetical protein
MMLFPYDPSSLLFSLLIECRLLLGPIESIGHAAQDAARKSLPFNNFQVRAYFAGSRVSRNDTRREDTCVVTTPAQLAIFLATKLFEELESSSTEIDQPLYCRRSSATETPRWPRTIVPTR